MTARRFDCFVSHAGSNDDWAEWVAWHLEDCGYSVIVDRHWQRGENWVDLMEQAIESSDWMIALFSRAYFLSRYAKLELQAWWTRPDGDQRLIPLRIERFEEIPYVYRPVLHADLFSLSDAAAIDALKRAVSRIGERRTAPRAKVLLAKAWNVPHRNPNFTGRDAELKDIHDRLRNLSRTVIQALHGMGGVGKTQMAIEYAHRFRAEYDQIWWINSDQPELIAEQLAALAVAAGVAEKDIAIPEAVDLLRAAMREHHRWLVIFDNAESARDIEPWLPPGPGHILITSRDPDWAGTATAVDVGPFRRADSVKMLRGQVGELSDRDAARLADKLGDLPLAMWQAAGALAQGTPVAEYERMLAGHAAQAMGVGKPDDYPDTLAGSVAMSLNRLAQTHPAAVELVRICALLAPEPVPLDLFTRAPADVLPRALAQLARRTDLLSQSAEAVRRVGLAYSTGGRDTLQLHRMTRAVIADTMSDRDRGIGRSDAEAIITAAQPPSSSDPKHWARWRQLMPHLLALDPGSSARPEMRRMANEGVWYLLSRGDARSADLTARALLETMTRALGEEHPDTLQALQNLAACRYQAEDPLGAMNLDELVLARRTKMHGPDHPDSLASASDLALDLHALGEFAAARDLNRRTLATRQRVEGPDHRHTLTSENNLALDLRQLGELDEARSLLTHCVDARKRVLGTGHPNTLISQCNLAGVLTDLGELETARRLLDEALNIRRRILPKNHSDIVACAQSLARVLLALGREGEAKAIERSLERARRRPTRTRRR